MASPIRSLSELIDEFRSEFFGRCAWLYFVTLNGTGFDTVVFVPTSAIVVVFSFGAWRDGSRWRCDIRWIVFGE